MIASGNCNKFPPRLRSISSIINRLSPILITTIFLSSVVFSASVDRGGVIRYQVVENSAPGTKIGSVLDEPGLRRKFPQNVLSKLEFRFVSEPSIAVAIGTNDGVIRTTGVIDRDAIAPCRKQDTCEVPIDVNIHPADYFLIVKVVINVIDVNDNAPRFTEPNPTVRTIVESASVGSTFPLPSATDADSPLYGIKRYELETSSNKFGLQSLTKMDGFIEVRLLLRETLDRETRDEYRLRLVVYDGGLPARNDTLNVTVRVTDANDNSPQFENSNYEVRIVENFKPYSEVITVRATDADEGANGRIKYGFATQTQSHFGKLFSINETTGVIFSKAKIDREVADKYSLTVTAEDAGQDSHTVDVTVHVIVDDINDNAPSITINSLVAVASDLARVPENVPAGTFVAHVTVSDPDAGLNGTVDCSIATDGLRSMAPLFSLVRRALQQSETEYRILTTAPLDREKIPKHNVTVSCEDRGTPAQRTSRHVQVIVDDDNDNNPIFSRDVYTASIRENNNMSATVIQVSATDADTGDNAIVRYSIVGQSAASYFNIDQRGVITAKQGLDRETNDLYRFEVLAMDSGLVSRSGSTTVVISVDDMNDERPTFLSASYSFSVNENEQPGTSVGQVQARDADMYPNNIIRYFFLQQNFAYDSFSIDPHNGTITTQKVLNREDQPAYHLVVSAVDPGSPPLTGSATVLIYVLDVNDNDPIFEFPSTFNSTVYVSNRLPPGFIVTTLRAKDIDSDANSQIKYRLISGGRHQSGGGYLPESRLEEGKEDEHVSRAFSIDPFLGTIFVNRRLDDIDHRVYRMTVAAIDSGTPPRQVTAHLNVIVNKTIPYTEPVPRATATVFQMTRSNVLIALIVGSICIVVIVTFIVIFVLMHRRNHRHHHHHHSGFNKSDSRTTEGVKMLTTRENGSSPEGTPVKTPPPPGRPSNTPGMASTLSSAGNPPAGPKNGQEDRYAIEDLLLWRQRNDQAKDSTISGRSDDDLKTPIYRKEVTQYRQVPNQTATGQITSNLWPQPPRKSSASGSVNQGATMVSNTATVVRKLPSDSQLRTLTLPAPAKFRSGETASLYSSTTPPGVGPGAKTEVSAGAGVGLYFSGRGGRGRVGAMAKQSVVGRHGSGYHSDSAAVATMAGTTPQPQLSTFVGGDYRGRGAAVDKRQQQLPRSHGNGYNSDTIAHLDRQRSESGGGSSYLGDKVYSNYATTSRQQQLQKQNSLQQWEQPQKQDSQQLYSNKCTVLQRDKALQPAAVTSGCSTIIV